MNKLKYPYGAKSALFITSDDLNPALIFNQKHLIYNPDQALANLKKAAELSQKYHFPISYGFTPNYTYKENNQFKIINFLDNKYLKWKEELKKQIKKSLCSIFAHGKYHLPNFMTPDGDYENKEDWKYIKEIILKEFKIETKTFRSPGYQWKKSQNWTYQDYILNLRACGFEIILDAAYSLT
ncbi:MAG: hypothetical protein HYU63_05015 [Armatimonadetes bacterium]|nr:hypothetical protein [Armatimonadota bacterium]